MQVKDKVPSDMFKVWEQMVYRGQENINMIKNNLRKKKKTAS